MISFFILSALTAVLMQTLRTLLDPENMGPQQINQGINVSVNILVWETCLFSYTLF